MTRDDLPLGGRNAFQEHCRASVSALYTGQGTLLCRVLGGALCYVDAADVSVAPHLAMDGFWETWNSVALGRSVRRGWRVADVGANHGCYTLLLAMLVGPEGHVTAIEPNPRLFQLLQRSVAANGLGDRVTLLPYAAASVNGDVELRVPRGSSGDGSLARRYSGELDTFRVPQRRLDEVIEGPLDFLKIDAEGADYDALMGARGLLPSERPAAILLEHHAPFHASPIERLQGLVADGFALAYVTDAGDVAPTSIAGIAEQPQRFWDLWLTRPGRTA